MPVDDLVPWKARASADIKLSKWHKLIVGVLGCEYGVIGALSERASVLCDNQINTCVYIPLKTRLKWKIWNAMVSEWWIKKLMGVSYENPCFTYVWENNGFTWVVSWADQYNPHATPVCGKTVALHGQPTVALMGHHYISFSLHYINFDLCEKNIMWLCIHDYLACIHNYLACIHKYLACIHNYLYMYT